MGEACHMLGVIPARGGSKGLENKNIRPLLGIPLIHYTIRASRESRLLRDCLVSTDSEEIMTVAREAGAWVPFLRPSELAGDTAPTYLTIQHAIRFYESQKGPVENVVVLQPIAPLRTALDIDKAVEIYLSHRPEADSLISVCKADAYHPQTLYKKGDLFLRPWEKRGEYTTRRQELEPVCWRNGAIYISRRDLVMEGDRLLGDHLAYYEMPRSRSVNIDGLYDFHLAEIFLRNETFLDEF
jgi:CMP-N,N'-diacetyllegionaminic acid synthase